MQLTKGSSFQFVIKSVQTFGNDEIFTNSKNCKYHSAYETYNNDHANVTKYYPKEGLEYLFKRTMISR